MPGNMLSVSAYTGARSPYPGAHAKRRRSPPASSGLRGRARSSARTDPPGWKFAQRGALAFTAAPGVGRQALDLARERRTERRRKPGRAACHPRPAIGGRDRGSGCGQLRRSGCAGGGRMPGSPAVTRHCAGTTCQQCLPRALLRPVLLFHLVRPPQWRYAGTGAHVERDYRPCTPGFPSADMLPAVEQQPQPHLVERAHDQPAPAARLCRPRPNGEPGATLELHRLA